MLPQRSKHPREMVIPPTASTSILGGEGNGSSNVLSGIYTYMKESTIPSERERAWHRRSRTTRAPPNMSYGFKGVCARVLL